MAKKLDYKNLGPLKIVTTQERIAPSPDMPPIGDDMKGVTIIPREGSSAPASKPEVAPVAATPVVEKQAQQVTPDVKPPEASSTPEGTPSAPSDGKQAVQIIETPSVDANTEEDEELDEKKASELPEWMRKRLLKAKTKRLEAEKKAQELEAKEKEKQAKLDAKDKELEFYKEIAMKPPATATPAKTETVVPPVQVKKEPPKMEDFEGQENPIPAFIDASVNYKLETRLASIEKKIDPAVQKAQQELAVVEVEHPDIKKVVNMENPAFRMLAENPITTVMIPASKNKLKLSYYLATNPTDAQRISLLTDPIDIAVELRKIEDKIFAKPSSKQTDVPAPATPAPATPAPAAVTVKKTNAPVPFKPLSPTGEVPLPPVTSTEVKPDDLRDRPGYEFLKKKRY